MAGARSLGGWWCYMRQPGAPSGVLKSKTGETDKRREEYFLRKCPLNFASARSHQAFFKEFTPVAVRSPTCSAQQEAGTRYLNAPRHPTPSRRAAQPPPRRSGCHRRSTPGPLATGWWDATQRQSLLSRTTTSQASTCDALEAAGLTSEDRRSTTAAPTSTGCRSRSTAAVLCGRQLPRGVGRFGLQL